MNFEHQATTVSRFPVFENQAHKMTDLKNKRIGDGNVDLQGNMKAIYSARRVV